MAVNVSIKVENNVTVADLILPGVGYGVLDDVFRLDEGVIGDYTVVYDPKNLCRGFELSVNTKDGASRAELRMPLPNGWRDTYFFYDYVRKLCQKFHTDIFVRDDEPAELGDIESFIFSDIKTSERVLRQMEDDINNGKYASMNLCGVRNPVAVDVPILRQIGGDTKKFDKFMHRLQAWDVYYAKSSVYQRKDGSLFGIYVLTEDVVSVAPQEPGLTIPNNIPKVEDWNVGLVFDEKMAGAVPYQAFLDFVGKRRQAYDATHFVVCLSKTDMKNLLLRARVDL